MAFTAEHGRPTFGWKGTVIVLAAVVADDFESFRWRSSAAPGRSFDRQRHLANRGGIIFRW